MSQGCKFRPMEAKPKQRRETDRGDLNQGMPTLCRAGGRPAPSSRDSAPLAWPLAVALEPGHHPVTLPALSAVTLLIWFCLSTGHRPSAVRRVRPLWLVPHPISGSSLDPGTGRCSVNICWLNKWWQVSSPSYLKGGFINLGSAPWPKPRGHPGLGSPAIRFLSL